MYTVYIVYCGIASLHQQQQQKREEKYHIHEHNIK